ncbi:MAG: extracellular solute-binding protein [Caldilineaceae bacterium]
MHVKQWWTGFVLLVVFSLIASACAGAAPAGGGGQPAAQSGAANSSGSSSGETVELRLWQHQNASFIAGNEELVKRYTAAHPNVKIKIEPFPYDVFIQTLQTSMPAGTEGDIIEMFGSWVCSYKDRLAEFPDSVLSYNEAKEIFYQAQLDGYYCDGKLYGLPQEFNIENGGVLVNPKMFKDAGLTYPPQWKTTEDLLNDAKKLVKKEGDAMTVSGFHFISGDGLAFQLLAGILQRGGEYWKPDHSGVVFTSPQAKATVEDMKSWVKNAGVTDPFLFNTDNNWVGTSFFNNQVAIGFVGPWVVPGGKTDHPDFQFDYVALPNYAGDKHYFAADAGWGYVVSPHSKHKEIAFDFAKFAAANADNAKTWNLTTSTVPALKAVAQDPTLLEKAPYLKASLGVLQYGRYVGTFPDRDLFWYKIVYAHLLKVLQDTEPVDIALQAIEDETNASFKK